MRIELSTIGKFHTFDLARQLYARGHLSRIYTGYPRFKLKDEGLPEGAISTFPYFVTPLLALRTHGLISGRAVREWDHFNTISLAKWVSRRVSDCDAFIGLSGSGLEAGTRVRAAGGTYICDRGSAHIRVQEQLLRDEHSYWSFPYQGIDPRIIDREEQEYERAHVVTVPSTFARKSFDRLGNDRAKVRTVPYGVDLSRFRPQGERDRSKFSVLFVGRVTLQKGIPYLLESFKRLKHTNKVLRIVGPYEPDFIRELKKRNLVPENVEFIGQVPQPKLQEYFSTSDVLVLPSIQEGLAMVMAQAMACGCPVIASENTGAEDLFVDGREGFIVPVRDTEALLERLQQIAGDEALSAGMREAALTRVASIGGWDQYGKAMTELVQSLVDSRSDQKN